MARKVSAAEILKHNGNGTDLWVVVDGLVYDMTEFAPEHPGGYETIRRYGGRDASLEYNSVHSSELIKKTLDIKFHIGKLDVSTIPDSWRYSEGTSSQSLQRSQAEQKPPLDEIINLTDFERAAEQSLSAKAWAFVNGASNDNLTRDANAFMLRRIWLRPAVMRNVAAVNTRTTLFGAQLEFPIFISPTGAARMAGPGGEIVLAQGAAATGIIHCLATPSSFPHTEILEATPTQAFFQLYVNKDRSKSEQAVREAVATGKVKALFVTVDVPVISKREADERIKSQDAPSGMTRDRKGAGMVRQASSFIDPTFSWDDLRWLRSITNVPIVVKGIQRSADAVTAMQLGCHGIVVSNHGGRAADTAQASIITLLELHKNCPEVFARMEVLIDGGFRRGSDVLKAVCLGASAVGIGRPFLYSLGYGREGVEHAVSLIKDEIETAMQLCGITDLMRDASPDYVNTNEIDHLVPALHHPYAEKMAKKLSKL